MYPVCHILHVVGVSILYSLPLNSHKTVCVYHSTLDKQFSSVHLWSAVIRAALNILLPIFWLTYACISAGYIPKSGINHRASAYVQL